MSHVTTIELEITDLDALAKAAEACGCELVRNQKTYKWWGSHVGDLPLPQGFKASDLGKCEHAIRVKGDSKAYEIGVAQKPGAKPGTYTMLYDFYGGGRGLMKHVANDAKHENVGKLLQSYSTQVAKRELARKGFRVTETVQNGKVVLRATR